MRSRFTKIRWVGGAALVCAVAAIFGGACGSDDGAPAVVDDDVPVGSSGLPATTADTLLPGSEDSTGFFPLCSPGEVRCSEDSSAVEICADTGLSWEVDIACGEYSTCEPCQDAGCDRPLCIGPCELSLNDPSAAGCAFVANRQLHRYQESPDGLVISNPNLESPAKIQIFEVPEGLLDEQPFDSFSLEPGTSETIELLSEFVPGNSTNLRTGGIFRVYSDIPVISYLHAPLQANLGNESSLLLPDQVLGTDYVVTSYPSRPGRGVSYFEIVALEDATEVTWTPPITTFGNGVPIQTVEAGATGDVILNRYETMRVVPSQISIREKGDAAYEFLDVSGTVIHSDKPVWVVGANKASLVPWGLQGTGDPLQEVLVPLQHWGTEYVMLAAEPRLEPGEKNPLSERTFYRIYAGRDDVQVQSDPPNPAFPLTLESLGDYVDLEFETRTNLVLSGDGPFLPVMYLRSQNSPEPDVEDTGYGDPAMVQMVPTAQYLDRYVFATGIGFFYNVVQISRERGDGEVRLIEPSENVIHICNDVDECDYQFETVGEYEVASVPISEGTYIAEGDSPFGLIQSGSAKADPSGEGDVGCVDPAIFCNSSYAYPGGMRAETIYTP